MKTIRNASTRPLRVKLPGGKVLHLGPGKTGQIAAGAEDHAAVRELIESGAIEVLGEGAGNQATAVQGPRPGANTHGHHQPLGIPPKGDR